MIKVSDRKFGSRELFAIVYLSIGIKVTDTTPNLLLNIGSTASWAMPIISGIALIVPFLLLLPLMKKYETGLVEISYELTGKFFGNLIALVLFLIIFSGTVINSRSYVDIVITMYYPDTPVFALLFLFILGTTCYIAYLGIDNIGRASWVVGPIILVLSLLLIVFFSKNLDLELLYPIAGPGVMPLIKGSLGYSSFFGDIIMVTVIYSHVRSFESFRTGALWGFGISSVKMVLYLATFVMLFDYSSVENIAFPYHHMTRLAMVGSLANHIEAVFLAMWFLGAALHFAIYLYLSALLLGKFLHFKQFKRLLLPLSGLTVMLGLLQDNFFQGVEARKLLLQSSSGFFILLPFFLWGLDRVKGRGKK
ncbi:MAG TPA: spore gernimation protein [Bacillus bacterium]|uniref:GerAB/ArcD/ProY family transporter n=1 Tax=Siminovitchia fordii TaxID=254759 RepID=UPI0003705D3C|nr:GerAB/ArcD/ProY family transporter [Siminovitchia fordii]HBZ08761.1 spore gernimation protein [Bacillus sp. (in: firmicutes)]